MFVVLKNVFISSFIPLNHTEILLNWSCIPASNRNTTVAVSDSFVGAEGELIINLTVLKCFT